MQCTTRDQAITKVTDLISSLSLKHPVRVAVDGRTASGKTTIADEIGRSLEAIGRNVIRCSIDGFHRPRAERYARGRYSAEGYYYDARDLDAVRIMLLDPLGPQGSLRYRTASFDLEGDRPLDQAPAQASIDDILIVDGTFLQRMELNGGWDVVVFVDVPEELAASRGAARDQDRLGGQQKAEDIYSRRYRPAFAIYDELCDPRDQAHILFDNQSFNCPHIRVQRSP